MKEEFINRYKYLYKKSLFILLPYMNEEYYKDSVKNIYLDELDENLLYLLEEFLLSDISYTETNLYKYLESKNYDREYLRKVRKGILLFEKRNGITKENSNKIKNDLGIWTILVQVRNYICSLSDNEEMRNKKLDALDEYFRLARYRNIDEVWTSGYKLTIHDVVNNPLEYSFMPEISMRKDIKSMGIMPNVFCNYLDNRDNHHIENSSILTEDEKKRVFFELNNIKLSEELYNSLSR